MEIVLVFVSDKTTIDLFKSSKYVERSEHMLVCITHITVALFETVDQMDSIFSNNYKNVQQLSTHSSLSLLAQNSKYIDFFERETE